MPQSTGKLKRVLTKIKSNNASGPQKRSVIHLPYHPDVPQIESTEPKTKKGKTKQNVIEPIANPNAGGDDMWKINWMIEYDANRKHLETERKNNTEISHEIEKLKEQNKMKHEMVVELLHRVRNKNSIIQRLVNQCLAYEKVNEVVTENSTVEATNDTDTNDTIECTSSMATSATENHISVPDDNTTEVPDDKTTGSSDDDSKPTISNNAVNSSETVIHASEAKAEGSSGVTSEFQIANDALDNADTMVHAPEMTFEDVVVISAQEERLNRPGVLHQCSNCGYTTDKKSTLIDHMAEFCVDVPVKNMECNICGKLFTRRGLRVHFNNFTTGLHVPRGQHSFYTAEEHEMCGFDYP